MKTKFTKFPASYSADMQWALFRRAGDAWLDAFNVLRKNEDKNPWVNFYVNPWIASFCIELFIKAIAAYVNKTFNGKDYSHNSTKIIKDYEAEIPIFHQIAKDQKLFLLIKEFESTIDTKFGQTSVSLDGDDQRRLLMLASDLNEELTKMTGIR